MQYKNDKKIIFKTKKAHFNECAFFVTWYKLT